ncbi:hypothetical protein NDU88_002475 [Pleurodeles waltl]|uniref:Uncharacterized protein n=1 Tax=Pleurodeles waltl TaxID=8319 RepID=A0AAV7SDS8_PLEWA|nr:hypothetical protein NDU88_002475 [Pleurodeles waltl]
MNTRPALRRPAALEEQEGAERLSDVPRRNLVQTGETESGAAWRVTALGQGALAGPRECRGRAAETRGAGPKETQQQGGERSQWALIARQSTSTPEVGAKRIRELTLWTHRRSLCCTKEQKGDGGGPKSAPRSRKPRREVAEPGPNRRDRERSGSAGDGAGAGGHSLGRRRAEGVLRRLEERTPKKHGSKGAGGVSGPRPPDNRAWNRGRENTGSDPLVT